MKKTSLAVCFVVLLSNSSYAQLLAQQYFAAPLALNPAMTGFIDTGDIRVTLNHASQWSSIASNPYTNTEFSVDAPVLRNKLPKGDALGIGIYGDATTVYYGSYGGKSIGLSGSYHRIIGKKTPQWLSVGAQASVNSLRGFLSDGDILYPVYSGGIMYSRFMGKHATFNAGYSRMGVGDPFGDYSWDYPVNFGGYNTGHVSFTQDLSSRFYLYASSACVLRDVGATGDIYFTAIGAYLLSKDSKKNTTVYLGGIYDLGEMISPYAGIEMYGMRLGLSYSISVNSYVPTGPTGAYGLSLAWRGGKLCSKGNTYKGLPRLY